MATKAKRIVVVRTYSAGVHVGEFVSQKGKEVILKNSRRLWRWSGANSLNEVATKGVNENYTRLSEPVAQIGLTEVIEVLDCSEEAASNLTRSRWAK